jgi:HSP20 family protein
VILLPKKKKPAEGEETEKTEVAVTTKKKALAAKKAKEKPTALAPAAPLDLWRAFDDVFERFRSDFEDLLFPPYWGRALSLLPETRVPALDLEDREKDYVLKAEMPGFKKEDIEIEVQEDAIAITGYAGWKYDKKGQVYICKERACETFYRMVELPEEIKVDDVAANLSDGVLEVTLPKKAPKQKRKVAIK